MLTDFGFGAPQLAVSTMLMATFGGLLLAIGFLADLVVRTSKAPSRVLPAYVVEVPEPDAERGGT